jgi:hypothetical protein
MDITLIYPFLPAIGATLCIFTAQVCTYMRYHREQRLLDNRITLLEDRVIIQQYYQVPPPAAIPVAIPVAIPEYYPPRYAVSQENIV